MKTIKQIREEYDSQFFDFDQVESLPEEIMLEGKDSNPLSTKMPLATDLPVMLIFRRISYRLYPNKQIIALYYSKTMDKYLSIPFGPKGNVNLSESVILSEEEVMEDWQKTNRRDNTSGMSQKAVNAYRRENPGSKLQTAVTEKNPSGKRAARRKSFCSRMGGMKKRLTSAKTARDPDSRINKALRRWNCEESFKVKLAEKRQERLDEFLPVLAAAGQAALGLGARALASGAVRSVAAGAAKLAAKGAKGALKGAGKAALWGAKKMLEPDKPQQGQAQASNSSGSSGGERSIPRAVGFSASDLARNKANDTAQSLHTQAAKKYDRFTVSRPIQQQENKISDIRKLISEDVQQFDLSINGKTVTLNNGMAKRIVEVYDSVNKKNKKIVENMLNEDLESFKKLLNFSIRN